MNEPMFEIRETAAGPRRFGVEPFAERLARDARTAAATPRSRADESIGFGAAATA